jgi:ATP-dependent Clp protease ATP-binding subunit ClpC
MGFERFTDRARRVVDQAQEEARMLDHNHVGPEHILLGLIRQGEGAAAQVLTGLSADLSTAREQVIRILEEHRGGREAG